MPFGLVNAPSTFQRAIYNLLNKHDLKFAIVYLDDIIVYSINFENHIQHLYTIILELQNNKMQINYKKSEYFCRKIDYLGYKIKKDSIYISKEKTKSIVLYPTPTNIKQVHQFIGLTSYYRRLLKIIP